jgi:hypothetical protein
MMTIHAVYAITFLHAEWNMMTDPKIEHRITEMGEWIVGGF